jgi:uncharacterized protein YndB with AHSA1/START domain
MMWVLYGAGALIALGLIAWLVGSLLPRDHVAQVAIDLQAPPARVWALIADVAGTARWRPNVKSVEMRPAVNGRVRFVETTSERPMLFEIVSQEPPAKQVVRVADEGLPFGGTWTWELTPSDAGTRLTMTEDGFIRNPIFRVMSRLFFPPTGTLNGYLRDVAKELGESAEPQVLRVR